MSAEYDNYLNEHIGNVAMGLNWMQLNLPEKLFDPDEFESALFNAVQHDISKYSIEEYPAYDAYFYGGKKTQKVKDNFDYAWLHHQNKNPHHWQFWVLIKDDPKTDGGISFRALEMPLCYVYEMIADWWTFSWRNSNLMEIFEWYDDHREVMVLHEKTREVVEKILGAMYEVLSNQARLEHSDIDYAVPDFLEHYGIKGQKWGIRNGPPYPLNPETDYSREERKQYGINNLKTARTANFESWGIDADHNALYITGISGSGKSTTADALAEAKDHIIRLDAYTEKDMEDEGAVYTSRSMQKDNGFTSYLNKNFEDWKQIGSKLEAQRQMETTGH